MLVCSLWIIKKEIGLTGSGDVKVIRETLCPTWDESLIFDDIVVYGIREEIIRNPPVVIVEIYDYDLVVSRFNALLGRFFTCTDLRRSERCSIFSEHADFQHDNTA